MTRPTVTILFAAGCLLWAAAPADGQRRGEAKPVAGEYEVKFERVVNNCTDVGMNLNRGRVALTDRGNRRIELRMPMVPPMRGTSSGDGKFKAQAARGATGIQGVDGQFSAAGRVDDGLIQMVFTAEYYAGKKPLCTQSWNVTGLRTDKLR